MMMRYIIEENVCEQWNIDLQEIYEEDDEDKDIDDIDNKS